MMRETDRILIGATSVAMMAPSAYTIGWSKQQHPEQMWILYGGLATSVVTVAGAILGDKYHGDKIMWTGLLASMGLFGYVTFLYQPPPSVP